MSHLSQEAVHRPGSGYSLYAGEVTGQLLVQYAKILNLKGKKCCLMSRCIKKQSMEFPMQYLEEQILNWKFMGWKVFRRKTWRTGEEFWSKKTKVLHYYYFFNQRAINLMLCMFIYTIILFIFRNPEKKAESG